MSKKEKYEIPRQIRIEPTLEKIICEIQEKYGYKTSAFVNVAVKEYLKDVPVDELDPTELGVKFYETKDNIFSFRFSKAVYEDILFFTEQCALQEVHKEPKKYSYFVHQAILHFINKLINQ